MQYLYDFLYWQLVTSALGFFLIFFRDDNRSIIFDIFSRVFFRKWYVLVFHLFLCYIVFPFTIPFSVVRIFNRWIK